MTAKECLALTTDGEAALTRAHAAADPEGGPPGTSWEDCCLRGEAVVSAEVVRRSLRTRTRRAPARDRSPSRSLLPP